MNPGEVWKDESSFVLIGTGVVFQRIVFHAGKDAIDGDPESWCALIPAYLSPEWVETRYHYAYATFGEFFDVKFEEARKEFSTRWRTLCKRVDAIREEHGLVVGTQKGEGNG